jgi:phosphoglycerate dehydrogenase-like enzyme
LLLPHLGYVTVENYALIYTQMVENLESCLAGKPKRTIT